MPAVIGRTDADDRILLRNMVDNGGQLYVYDPGQCARMKNLGTLGLVHDCYEVTDGVVATISQAGRDELELYCRTFSAANT